MKTEHKAILLGLATAWRERAAHLKKNLRTKKQCAAIGESKHTRDLQVAMYEDRADELEKSVSACV